MKTDIPVELLPYPTLPTEAEVQAFEATLGFALPNAYRRFLLSYNGPEIVRPEETKPDTGYKLCFCAEPIDKELADTDFYGPEGFWDVNQFFGLLRQPGKYGDLMEIYRNLVGDMPRELLPIANQYNNAKYFLCLNGARRGEVLFTSHATHNKSYDGETVTQADYVCVAKSFEQMLEKLAWHTFVY